MTPWALFDDDGGRFGPMTDLRTFSEVRTGAATTLERLIRCWGPPRTRIVPESMAALVAERGGETAVGDRDTPVVLLNGRWRGRPPEAVPERGEAWLDAEGDLAIAHLGVEDLAAFERHRELPDSIRTSTEPAAGLYRRPWEVLEDLPDRLREDLETPPVDEAVRVEAISAERVGTHPISIDVRATIGRGVVLDATHGPIAISAGASIGHLSVLHGPVWVGPGSVVADRTQLKAATVVGPVCKVGGEIGATIFQGHANKVHDGHLGDSWIGEWANLGAGTTNSNLLNTYGEVSMRLEPDGPSERSGRTALGCLVGDHVKFAILVRIMTGSSFGTGSMVATTDPPRSVGRFRWLTARGESGYRLERFLETMATVQARRGVAAGPAYLDRLRALHEAGRADR